MKKIFLLVAFIIGTLVPSQVSAESAAVTGTVQLQAKATAFPDNLLDIFIGHDTELPLGKKGKKISVEATYTNESRLRVSELGEFEDSEERYMFDIPIPTVMQTFTTKKAKSTKNSGIVEAIFSTLSGSSEDDDTESIGQNFGSQSIVKMFNIKKKSKKKAKASTASLGQAISVVKIIASRKGNKGSVVGSFASAGKKAQGRFALKFVFSE